MKTISLCMIVKDEEKVLEKCLKSIKNIVDEIIIIDTGSSDNTKNIALKYTNLVFDYKWNYDFASARNFSLEKATKDYILWLDADDYLKPSQAKKILKLKQDDSDYDLYFFLYDFDNNYQPFYRERLFKRAKNYRFSGKIHEAIAPNGKIKYEDIVISQQRITKGLTKRNLEIFLNMTDEEFTSRDYYYFAKELYRHEQIPKAIFYFNKFLTCQNCYFENVIDTCFLLGNIYQKQQQYSLALKMYFMSFYYDLPRANILCEIANVYYQNNDYLKAIYYYKMALKSKKTPNNGFIYKDYFKYIPAISLSLCYDKIKDYQKGYYYNELAYKFKKNLDVYLYNKKYFLKKMLEEE